MTDLRLDGPSKKGFSTVDPVAALAALGAAAAATVATAPARPRRSLARDGELLSPRLTAALETLTAPGRRLRDRCAARIRLAASAVRRRWRAGAMFRGKLRRIVSWGINCFIYFMLCWMVITYAMQFGEVKTRHPNPNPHPHPHPHPNPNTNPNTNPSPNPSPNTSPNPNPNPNPNQVKTRQWLLSWVVASAHAWLVIEPAEVILIAFLPQLLENQCISNCREFAKELGFY